MVEVKWTVDAITDIDGIATFIARDSPRSAQDMVERFFRLRNCSSTNHCVESLFQSAISPL